MSGVRWQVKFLAAAATALVPGSGLAQTGAAKEDVGAAPELRIDREVGAVRELQLTVGQNRLLVLSEPVGRVSVASPDVADLKVVTPTQLLLTAKGVGITDLTLWDKEDGPLVIALTVTLNLERLRTQISELFPGESINVSTAGDLVVLSGEVSDVRIPDRVAELARLHTDRLANLLKVSGNQQVHLEVKFAEVSRDGLREFGLNFFTRSQSYEEVGGVFNSHTPAGTFLDQGGTPSIGGTGRDGGPLGRFGGHPPEVAAQPFGDAFSLFLSSYDLFPFSVMLSMLESRGLAKTLAEPSLVTLSGQEAKFLAGGELPIPISSALGTVNVQWKEFGIGLRFIPTVIEGDTIHLKLAAEVSDLDPNVAISLGGFTIPGLVTRESETTVRLGDGQSFAIAGLLSDRVRSKVDEIPFLGKIPILGALFRSVAYHREETELLVVVTARLTQPVAPHELPPLPTDYETFDAGTAALFFLGWDSRPTNVAENREAASEQSPGSAQPVPEGATSAAPTPEQRGPMGLVGFFR